MTVRPVHVLLLLAPLAGCMRPNRASVEVYSICSPSDDCTFKAKCDMQYMGNQIVDLDLTGNISLAVEVHNQLTNNANEDLGQANTHDARVQQVVTSYSAPFAVASATTDIQQIVPANGTSVLGIELLDAAAYADLAAGVGAGLSVQVIADVKLKGILADGSKFETGEYRVPVQVCRGCLAVIFPPCLPPNVASACLNYGQWPATAVSCLPPGGGGTTGYTLGGAVTGLTDTNGLTITCNGAVVAVAAGDTTWETTDRFDTGIAYTCQITTPAPTQPGCALSNATGTVGGINVTNIDLTCP